MNYLTLDLTKGKIVFTKHSKTRAVQRARLFFSKCQIENIEPFLTKDFRHSKIDQRYINCPFYSNMKQSMRGRGSFDSYGKFLTYHCSLKDDDTIVICTITLTEEK